MSAVFSPLSVKNYQAAFEIQCQSHLFPWSEKTFSDCLDSNYFAVQLKNSAEVQGFYIGLKILDEATLMDIAVAPKWRGQGLGQQLLTEFLLHCRRLDTADVWLEVRASNQSAIRLYEKSQFEVIDVRKNYYPTLEGKENALVMKKSL